MHRGADDFTLYSPGKGFPDLVRQTLDGYAKALFDTDKATALTVVQRALDSGLTPEQIVFEVVIPGMEQMGGGLLSDNMITLSQHFLASQIAEELTDRLVPRFAVVPEVQGTVVIGTSFGDFHGLGKKILSGCLRARLFQVHDLGLNVTPERFVEAALEVGAEVIGVSSMMLHTAVGERGPKGVRAILRERGLEHAVKLVVGGAPYRFHDDLFRQVEADGWGASAIDAPAVIAALVKEVRGQ